MSIYPQYSEEIRKAGIFKSPSHNASAPNRPRKSKRRARHYPERRLKERCSARGHQRMDELCFHQEANCEETNLREKSQYRSKIRKDEEEKISRFLVYQVVHKRLIALVRKQN